MTVLITLFIAMAMVLSQPVYAKNTSKSFGVKLCENSSQYTCYTVKKKETWKKLFPDSAMRDLVMRINRMNTKLHAGLVIAIPANGDTDPLNYSPLPVIIDPPGKKTIIVSLQSLAFGAYNSDGQLQYWGPVSGGRGYCPDINRRCHTSIGKFSIYHKLGAGCVSSKYPVGRGGAPMPYCMFFNGGYALHGSYDVPGYNASHGCVRLFVNDAKWLNQVFTAGQGSVTVLINK